MKDYKVLISFILLFLVMYFLPLSDEKIQKAILESFNLLQWYAREHTLACVVPALFISGAIITFLSQASVMKYLGPKSNKWIAYSVASVAGVILAVCSCSVLPMFAGIYKLGAGLGPASAFLYSGPGINILAIFLTASVLGAELGIARAIGSIAFAFLIGLLMALIFRKSEQEKVQVVLQVPEETVVRPLWKTTAFMSCMVLFLVFSDWFNPNEVIIKTKDNQEFSGVILVETKDDLKLQLDKPVGKYAMNDKIIILHNNIAERIQIRSWVVEIREIRWYLAGLMGILVLIMTKLWFSRDEAIVWMENTWDFAKMLVPILFGGVFLVGFIGALVPEEEVVKLVGDNSLKSNLIASVVGALFYFATLTEVPILQSLIEHGMHKGPALTLLLAGPALSLPSMIAIWKIMGGKRAIVFILLVMILSAFTGMIFGMF